MEPSWHHFNEVAEYFFQAADPVGGQHSRAVDFPVNYYRVQAQAQGRQEHAKFYEVSSAIVQC
jgi:hypothetical protein